MRVMLDTNILISMLFFPSAVTRRFKNELIKHEVILCDYVIREMQLVTERKFPNKLSQLDCFFAELPFEQVYTPNEIRADLFPSVRDAKDTPILITAMTENVDVFVSGDKDFLVLQEIVSSPQNRNMQQFLDEYSE